MQENSLLAEWCKGTGVFSNVDAVAGALLWAVTNSLGFPKAVLFLTNGDGNLIHEHAGAKSYPLKDSPSPAARACREGRTICVNNPSEWGQVPGVPAGAPLAAVPLMLGDAAKGAIVVATTAERRAGEPDPLPILEGLAKQAACAIERLRSDAIAGRRKAELEALEELDRAILAATRLDEVLRQAVQVAVSALGGRWGAAWTCAAEGALRPVAVFGVAQPEGRDAVAALADHASGALRSRSVLRRSVGDPTSGGEFPVLCAPLIAFGETMGAIAVAGRVARSEAAGRAFAPEDEPFLWILASHVAVAVQNARLTEQLREARLRLQEAQGALVQTEKLAALGEMSAKMAHEIRNPLSAIGGFARRIEKAMIEEDPNRGYASIIARETRRLEAILNEQLEFARARPPRLGPTDLNALVRETLQLVREEIEGHGVRLLEACESRVPAVLLDADRVKQVLLNILKNAKESTREGQRIRVRTRASEGWAQIEIANDGERMPGEVLDQLFVPFATARSQGCGLGLAVADQIVKEHGGEIRVRSDPEWTVVFTVSLPIRTNQDRRHTPERRARRDRRRAA